MINLVSHPFGWMLLSIFIAAYFFIAFEEKYHIDKAKPALFSGTLMFILISIYYAYHGISLTLFEDQINDLILEISEIFFFLFVKWS